MYFILLVVSFSATLLALFVIARSHARRVAETDDEKGALRVRRYAIHGYLIGLSIGYGYSVLSGAMDLVDGWLSVAPLIGQLPGRLWKLAAFVAFGPGLLCALAVFLGVFPTARRVSDVTQPVTNGTRQFLAEYVVRVSPAVGFVGLASGLSPGLEAGLGVAVAFVAYSVGKPILVELRDTRPLMEAEVDALGDEVHPEIPVRVFESTVWMDANGAAVGLLPGVRRIYLTEPLLNRLEDDAVAAVVAHELGHHRRYHLLVSTVLGGVLVGVLGGVVSLGNLSHPALLLIPALLLVERAWGRWREFDADRFATEYVDGYKMAETLDTLADLDVINEDTSWVDELLSDHPRLDRRTARLRPDSEA